MFYISKVYKVNKLVIAHFLHEPWKTIKKTFSFHPPHSSQLLGLCIFISAAPQFFTDCFLSSVYRWLEDCWNHKPTLDSREKLGTAVDYWRTTAMRSPVIFPIRLRHHSKRHQKHTSCSYYETLWPTILSMSDMFERLFLVQCTVGQTEAQKPYVV